MDDELIQLHYHLADGAHAMDAHVRNRCEAEALAAFQQVADLLGVQITIETIAFQEGGLRELWKLIAKPEHVTPVVLTGLVQLFINVWNSPSKELEAVNIAVARATLEEKNLTIQKLRAEIKKLAADAAASAPSAAASAPLVMPTATLRATTTFNTPTPPSLPLPSPPSGLPPVSRPPSVPATPRILGKMGNVLSLGTFVMQTDVKFATRRSNFYKALLPYSKVTAVALGAVKGVTPVQEHIVYREEFRTFVMTSDKQPTEVVEDALIEIVAPVISGGNLHWKGIYNGETISFAMRDKAFKDMVKRRQISFQSGDAIKCMLNVERKVDMLGDIIVTGYSVVVVITHIDGTTTTEMPHATKRKEPRPKDQTTLPLWPLVGESDLKTT
jgi:hypothetical protein